MFCQPRHGIVKEREEYNNTREEYSNPREEYGNPLDVLVSYYFLAREPTLFTLFRPPKKYSCRERNHLDFQKTAFLTFSRGRLWI